MFGATFSLNAMSCMIRPRVNALISEAIGCPLVIVCAGAGYGKTYAVGEFIRSTSIPTLWLQISEYDNAGTRFWTKYVKVTANWNKELAEKYRLLGFPDTTDKRSQYIALRRRYRFMKKHITVIDDAHLAQHPDILRFLELRVSDNVINSTVILICREMPKINISKLQMKGLVSIINEKDLEFTESELDDYLSEQSVVVSRSDLQNILEDTGGWAFAVNLVSRSLKVAPGYEGYTRIAMKQNIYSLMESEVFNASSKRLQDFMIRISLIDHLSEELIKLLAEGDETLVSELKNAQAYIRFESGISAYIMHHLFLELLRTKHGQLAKDSIQKTYSIAASWCASNGFINDALRYYEKNQDYQSIVDLLQKMPVQMPLDVAALALTILESAPKHLFYEQSMLAVLHVRILVRLGRWDESLKYMQDYEKRFLQLPDDSAFRNKSLGLIYFCWANLRALMSVYDDNFDFDEYYKKMADCIVKTNVSPDQYSDIPIGMWASIVGTSNAGAPEKYIKSAKMAIRHISRCWDKVSKDIDTLCLAELLFYQGQVRDAEAKLNMVVQSASENLQFEIEHKALFYILRIAVWQGDLSKAQSVLNKIAVNLNNADYAHRFYNHDTAISWYYLALRRPEMISAWLKRDFSTYTHAYFLENQGNQIKARYHYACRSYPKLLAYIEGVKHRESILYGRIEMLILEACVHLQSKNKDEALTSLSKAYRDAETNNIIMPFVELGKDMRTLAALALRTSDNNIARDWLEKIMRKSATYAKHQSLLISNYEKANGKTRPKTLSAREKDILSDLYHGLTRPEIATKQNLSANTVNSAINSIFNKLGVHSTADVIRIAAEEKLV